MNRKLDASENPTPEKLRDNFRLMIKNCLLFNPPATLSTRLAKHFKCFFDEKWKKMPVPRFSRSERGRR